MEQQAVREPTSTGPLEFLAGYAEAYETNHFGRRVKDIGLDPESIEEAAPKDFLRFLYRHYAFNRAGGAKAGYNDIALEAVEEVGGVDPEELWEVFVMTCEQRDIGLNERVNRGAVYETASLIEQHGNLFAWVEATVTAEESIEPVYETIGDIRGFGEKITRFFIRDAAWVTGVEGVVPVAEAPYLHPMDVWTRRVAHVVWPESWSESDARIAQIAAENCDARGVSHAAFNQGAWYFGAKVVDGDREAFVRELAHISSTDT